MYKGRAAGCDICGHIQTRVPSAIVSPPGEPRVSVLN
ncbi:rCG26747, partial [Rattus norvegicus]